MSYFWKVFRVQDVVFCVLLWLVAIVTWEVMGLKFEVVREELGDEIQASLHENGQAVAREMLKTAGKYMASKAQPNLVDRNVRTAEFASWADEVYDPEKPAVEWKSPYSLLGEMTQHYMFGLARKARPYDKITEQEAMRIASRDEVFNHFLEMENFLSKLGELQLQASTACSWSRLEVLRNRFEAVKEGLKQKLGDAPESKELKPPKVSIPATRIVAKIASC